MTKQYRHEKEDWITAKWRPAMGWMYMGVCIFDFVIAPILWSILQAKDHSGAVTTEWNPLTLQGGGLFHLAMGGILGIAAYGRTQEKLTGTHAPLISSTTAPAPVSKTIPPEENPPL